MAPIGDPPHLSSFLSQQTPKLLILSVGLNRARYPRSWGDTTAQILPRFAQSRPLRLQSARIEETFLPSAYRRWHRGVHMEDHTVAGSSRISRGGDWQSRRPEKYSRGSKRWTAATGIVHKIGPHARRYPDDPPANAGALNGISVSQRFIMQESNGVKRRSPRPP